jgi:phosphopantothenoylcysteine decarboxylase / phosphopantothenate---cysteine ligase
MAEGKATAPLVGLGVSGGIGAYKAVEVARLLQQQGYDVQAILTRNARRFIGPLTFEAITRRPVITGQFSPGLNANIEHIALATEMRALVVAPATANVLAKLAQGQADDFLSALYLATRAPLVVAPASWRLTAPPSWTPAKGIWPAAGSAKAVWRNRRPSWPPH